MTHRDKVYHFLIGALIQMAFGLIGYPTFGWWMSAFIGALKEAYDIENGTPEVWDFLATLAGGTATYLVLA